MNRVGAGGKGESVWLAWFAIAVFRRFAALAEARGDSTRAADLRRRADALRRRRRGQRLGRRLVPPRLLRRRHPAGLGPERRLPDRLARRSPGPCSPARPTPSGPAGRWSPSTTRLVDRQGRLILLFTPPFDAEPIDPGYIKGYLPGHPRERRPVHPRGHLGRPGVRRARSGPACLRAARRSSTRSDTPRTRRASSATRSSPTSSRATSTAGRPTSAGAAGPGTPARPPGSTARSSRRSSACTAAATA